MAVYSLLRAGFTCPPADTDAGTAVRHTLAVGCAAVGTEFHLRLAHHAEATLSTLGRVVRRALAVCRRHRTRRHVSVRTHPDHDRVEGREGLRDALHVDDVGFANFEASAEIGQAGIDGDVSVAAGAAGVTPVGLDV